MLNYCGRLLKTPVKTVTATASLLCFLSPVASEQPSGSSVSRGEAVPQLPEFLFSLQWHRPARHLLCDRQTQNWRHDALVPECLVSKDSRNHTDTCKAVYCPFKLCNRALTLYKCPIQDEPVHHSDRQRYRQRKDAAESQSDWTAQRYRKRFSCTHKSLHIVMNRSQHTSLFFRNNANLRWHWQAHPELRASYSSCWVGRSHRCE